MVKNTRSVDSANVEERTEYKRSPGKILGGVALRGTLGSFKLPPLSVVPRDFR
jgi:hypothetical protein